VTATVRGTHRYQVTLRAAAGGVTDWITSARARTTRIGARFANTASRSAWPGWSRPKATTTRRTRPAPPRRRTRTARPRWTTCAPGWAARSRLPWSRC
jgi:hypothetical protein